MIRLITIVAWTVNAMDIPDIEPILAITELTSPVTCACKTILVDDSRSNRILA